MGRIRCIDLPSDVAEHIFASNVLLSSCCGDGRQLFAYPCAKFRASPVWPDLVVHRTLLREVFSASCGELLHQECLLRQLTSFIRKQKCDMSDDAIEKSVYRLRAMMSQLRRHKKKGRRIPERYRAAMLPVVAVCNTSKPHVPSSHASGKIVCCSSSDSDVLKDTPQQGAIILSSESDEPDRGGSGGALEGLIDALFDTPSKPPKPIHDCTPPKLPASSCAVSAAGTDIDFDMIDSIIATSGSLESSRGPTAEMYRKGFPCRKAKRKRGKDKGKDKGASKSKKKRGSKVKGRMPRWRLRVKSPQSALYGAGADGDSASAVVPAGEPTPPRTEVLSQNVLVVVGVVTVVVVAQWLGGGGSSCGL